GYGRLVPLHSCPTRRSSDLEWTSVRGNSAVICESIRSPGGEHALKFVCRIQSVRRRRRMIKVLIADDHGIVRTGLKLLFERIPEDRKSTRLNSSHGSISYAV